MERPSTELETVSRGVPMPLKGETVPLGGIGILMSSGLPGTMLSGKSGM